MRKSGDLGLTIPPPLMIRFMVTNDFKSTGCRANKPSSGHREFRFGVLLVRLAPDRSHFVHRELVPAPFGPIVKG